MWTLIQYMYRGTSYIRNCHPPKDHQKALGIGYCRVLGWGGFVWVKNPCKVREKRVGVDLEFSKCICTYIRWRVTKYRFLLGS